MSTIGPSSYDQSAAENQRLRQQLNGIHINLDKDEVSVSNLQAEQLQVDQLDVSVPGLKKLAQPLLNPASYASGSSPRLPDLAQLKSSPVKVIDGQVELPESALNQVLSHTKVDGVSDLNVKLGENGQLDLGGKAHRFFLNVPFDVKGSVAADGPQKVRFSLENATIGGFLPVPKMVTNLFASLATNELAKAHVEQQGQDFVVDVGDYVPKNVSVGISGLTTHDGNLVVNAGTPPAPANGTKPTLAQLQADNRQLEQKLNGVQINIDKEQVGFQNVQAAAVQIDKLDVDVPGLKKLAEPFLNPATVGSGGTAPKIPDASQLEKLPIKVEDARVRLPESAINQVLSHTDVSGVSGLSVGLQPGGEMDLKGKAKGLLFDVPFNVQGHISAAGPEKIRFAVQDTTIGGFLPVPKLVTDLFASLSTNELAKAHVTQSGANFDVDVNDYIPKNVNVGLRSIGTQGQSLVVDAGPRP